MTDPGTTPDPPIPTTEPTARSASSASDEGG
jgi:hypothetical protein